MIKILPNMDSGCSKTPLCKSQQRSIGIAMRKVPHDEIVVNHGHFYTSGFLRRGDVIVYFNSGDFRFFSSGYARYADHFKDYTGKTNVISNLENLDKIVDDLLSKKVD